MAALLRAAVVAGLFGIALALALPALGLSAVTTGRLVATYWPVVPIAAGAAGLRRGLGRDLYGRWLPLILCLGGCALLLGHLAGVPLGTLALAALLAWAALAVARHGRRAGSGTKR